jgi:phage terminase large subunit-like protein
VKQSPLALREKTELYEKAVAIAKQKQVEYELPHLFSFKPYQWTLDYWNSTNRMKFITAANQASKSSTQIRHAIDLATEPKKWAKFFPRRNPMTFWYIYPDGNKIEEEFAQKWVKEFLPRGAMKKHPQYGWEPIYMRSNFVGIKFFSGVTMYFKSWRQDFQASTIDAIFVDEEIPFAKYDELAQRINMVDGIFSMVFTATLGQKEWFETIELMGKRGERFPEAFKRQISLEYDCKYYADGSPSPFTDEEVARRKAKCSSEREINKRIHGRFVSDEGLVVPSFSRSRNYKQPAPIDRTWNFFGGVDIGSGGKDSHPAAISIVAVNRPFTKGRLVRFWKGNQHETTDSSDILNQYIAMTKDLTMTGNYYDWAAKEFYIRSQRAGFPFMKAEKARDFGFDLMNTLFKHELLDIEEGEHSEELLFELETLKLTHKKQKAEDDGIDSLRYAISSIGWDFSNITLDMDKPVIIDPNDRAKPRNTRHEKPLGSEQSNEYNFENDIEEYNELLGGY